MTKFKVGDWVVNEYGHVCKLKYIYKREELTKDVHIADGSSFFGVVTVFLDKARLATEEEVKTHKDSKERPFKAKDLTLPDSVVQSLKEVS